MVTVRQYLERCPQHGVVAWHDLANPPAPGALCGLQVDGGGFCGQPLRLELAEHVVVDTENARPFVLMRDADETGLSGTGVVAWGVRFPDGKCVTRWCGTTTDVRQTCVWDDLEHVRAVHGHDGKTRIIWTDDGTEG